MERSSASLPRRELAQGDLEVAARTLLPDEKKDFYDEHSAKFFAEPVTDEKLKAIFERGRGCENEFPRSGCRAVLR